MKVCKTLIYIQNNSSLKVETGTIASIAASLTGRTNNTIDNVCRDLQNWHCFFYL